MSLEKPWLKSYEPHVPEHIDYPEMTLPEALEKTAADHPDHVVHIFKDNKITYREHMEVVNRFAAALQELGVNKGDRVAIHLPNCPQFAVAYAATLKAGAVVVPCNPIYTARELKHQLNDSGAEVIVTLSAMYPILKQIRSETKLRHVVVAKIKTYFPTLTKLLFTLLLEKKTGHKVDISGDENTHWFSDLLAEAPEKPQPVDISWMTPLC